MNSLIKKLKFQDEYKAYKELSMEQINEDLDNYFNYLKSSYAGYLANGGDDSFLKPFITSEGKDYYILMGYGR